MASQIGDANLREGEVFKVLVRRTMLSLQCDLAVDSQHHIFTTSDLFVVSGSLEMHVARNETYVYVFDTSPWLIRLPMLTRSFLTTASTVE